MKIVITIFCVLFLFTPGFSQEEKIDSAIVLDEVIIRSFEQNRPLRSAVTPVYVLKIQSQEAVPKTSFVHPFNTIPGVRMEERSPGSYRINIRGSSLRSPFGVRNVKVYWNELPVTDAGGNTYFNQFAWNNIASMELYKGPAGSMYGAGTGGLILLNPIGTWEPGVSAEYMTGSYNLQNVFTSARFGRKENMNQFTFAHNSNDGYRDQSQMRRNNFSWVSRLRLSDRQQFSAAVLFTNMYYQTPGALTLNEFTSNPKAARPSTGSLPSAEAAKAAIKQLNFLAGFNHYYKITPSFTNQITFYGSMAEINNPAIRNYERRTEPGFGGRSIFVVKNKEEIFKWQLTVGGEFQHGFSNTLVFKNVEGSPDSLQTNDDIVNTLNTYFVQGDAQLKEKWLVSAGVSVNRSKVGFTRLSQFPIITRNRYYRDELAPRLSVKNLVNDHFTVTGTISRGYSPPTLAELLPSTSVISIGLEAEYGWNFELYLEQFLFEKRLKLGATGFYFNLNKALVQRRDSSGADFFVNAGNIRQKGIELLADYKSRVNPGFIKSYILHAAYTFNHFRYGEFLRGTTDFSGKIIPSVPDNTLSLATNIYFAKGIYVDLTYYTTGRIFLNDANTATADGYHLLGARTGWRKNIRNRFVLHLFAGADNLFDEVYSLGNDINAAAGRFYNAAAPRNYYTGFSFQWISPRN